ncbi:MAG: hypothetical protein ACI86S_001335 [Paracoccaceae bacterium]|jgi:hypothetical protein
MTTKMVKSQQAAQSRKRPVVFDAASVKVGSNPSIPATGTKVCFAELGGHLNLKCEMSAFDYSACCFLVKYKTAPCAL